MDEKERLRKMGKDWQKINDERKRLERTKKAKLFRENKKQLRDFLDNIMSMSEIPGDFYQRIENFRFNHPIGEPIKKKGRKPKPYIPTEEIEKKPYRSKRKTYEEISEIRSKRRIQRDKEYKEAIEKTFWDVFNNFKNRESLQDPDEFCEELIQKMYENTKKYEAAVYIAHHGSKWPPKWLKKPE